MTMSPRLDDKSPRYRGLYSPRDGWQCYANGKKLEGEQLEIATILFDRKYERRVSPRYTTISYAEKMAEHTEVSESLQSFYDSQPSPLTLSTPKTQESQTTGTPVTYDASTDNKVIHVRIRLYRDNNIYEDATEDFAYENLAVNVLRGWIRSYCLLNADEIMESYYNSLPYRYWEWVDQQSVISFERDINN